MSQSCFDVRSRLRSILVAATGAAVLGAFAPGIAVAEQAGKDHTPPQPPANPLRIQQEHKVGEYGGVTPGIIYRYRYELEKKGTKSVERVVKRRKNRRANRRLTVSWIGFQPKGGGAARVFVQLNREATYSQRVDKSVLVVTIEGARTGSRNARRRIDTRYFDTSLMMISAKRVRARGARKDTPAQKSGVALYIQFKNPADAREAQASLEKLEDGYYYLYLDFGAGTELPKAAGDK